MEKKVIALIRTSTIQQEVDAQREEVIASILADGYSMDEIEVVGGKGASAIKMDEAYQKNMDKVYQLIETVPTIKAVYAWSIDRIGRIQSVLHTFREYLVEHKIQLVIKNPSYRLLDENGNEDSSVSLAFTVYAALAVEEMKQKKARFNRARKRNAEIGKANGGGKCVPFGYEKDKDGYFIINEEEAAVVRLIFELHNSGKYSLTKLAMELNDRGYLHRGKKFTFYYLRSFIKSTVPVGYSDIHKKKTGWSVRRNYPQIISKEIWEQAQTVLKANKVESFKGTKHYYLAAKLMVCGECKHHYTTSGLQYRCKLNATKKALKQLDLPYCNNNITIYTDVLDGIVWSLAREKHLNFLLGEKEVSVAQNKKRIEVNLQKIATHRALLANADAQKGRINDRWNAGRLTDEQADRYLDEIDAKCADAKNAIAALESENQALENQLNSISNLTYNAVLKLSAALLTMDDEAKMFELVHQYIKYGTIDRATIDGKSCLVLNFYFYDGTTETIYYFSRSRKHQLYKRGKLDKRLRYAFTDSEGNSYNPIDMDRLTRDKDGVLVPSEISRVTITDSVAGKVLMDELLKQRAARQQLEGK